MSSKPESTLVRQEGELATRREVMRWNWPVGTRRVLTGAVMAAALGLAVVSRSVPRSGAEIVRAPDLVLDLNTVPRGVLETLPHVGQTLVRKLVAAREQRPLASLEDAGRRVRGLGPVTLAQIAPYVRFEPSAGRGLDDSESVIVDQSAAKPRATRRKTTTRSRKLKSAARFSRGWLPALPAPVRENGLNQVAIERLRADALAVSREYVLSETVIPAIGSQGVIMRQS